MKKIFKNIKIINNYKSKVKIFNKLENRVLAIYLIFFHLFVTKLSSMAMEKFISVFMVKTKYMFATKNK